MVVMKSVGIDGMDGVDEVDEVDGFDEADEVEQMIREMAIQIIGARGKHVQNLQSPCNQTCCSISTCYKNVDDLTAQRSSIRRYLGEEVKEYISLIVVR